MQPAGSQCIRIEVTSVLLFLRLTGLVDLVTGRNDEVQVGVLCGCDFQRAVPAEAVVAGCGVCSACICDQCVAALSLTLGCADLRVTDIQHLDVGEAAGLVDNRLGLYAVLFNGVVVSGVFLETGDGYLIGVVSDAAREAGVDCGSLAGVSGQCVLVGAEVHDRRCLLAGFIFAVPGKVQLGFVCTGVRETLV